MKNITKGLLFDIICTVLMIMLIVTNLYWMIKGRIDQATYLVVLAIFIRLGMK